MRIRMLALDLDGTLLRDDKTISEFTLAQLRRCRSLGIKVVVATARSRASAARFVELFEVDGAINYGGGTASVRKGHSTGGYSPREGGQVIAGLGDDTGDLLVYNALVPAEVADVFIQQCLHTRSVRSVGLAGERSFLTNDPDEPKKRDSSHYVYDDFRSLPNQNAYKIWLITEDMGAVRQLADRFDSLTFVTYTGEDMHSFSSKRAVKDLALRALADHFGIAMQDVAAFGNDTNDLSMLSACGVGVAVGSAVDELKSIADEVCVSNNEDGVARWIAERIAGDTLV